MGLLRCSFCHDTFQHGHECPQCGTVLHTDCLAETRTCPTLGCQSSASPGSEASVKGGGKRSLGLTAVIATVFALLVASLLFGPLGRVAHTTWLRNFADHDEILKTCRELLEAHPDGGHLESDEIPDELKGLGSRCFVEIRDGQVSVDVGSFWVDAYGFNTYSGDQPEGAWGEPLVPCLYWWDSG